MANGDHLPRYLAARFNSNLPLTHQDSISFVFDSTFPVIYYQLTRTRLTQIPRKLELTLPFLGSNLSW